MAHLCSAHIGNKTFTLPRFGSKRSERKAKGSRKKDDVYGFGPGEDPLLRTGTLPARIGTKSPTRGGATHQSDRSGLKRHQSETVGRWAVSSPRSPDVSKPLTIHIPSHSPVVCQSPVISVSPVKGQQTTPHSPTAQTPDCTQKDWHVCKQPLYTSLNSSGNSLNDSGIDSGLDSSRRTDCSQPSSSGSATDSPGASSIWSRAKADVKRRLEQSSAALPANIPMLVTRDYTPPGGRSTTKAQVRRGMIVNAQYKADDWVYVKTSLETKGFVPYSCVDCMGTPKLARDFSQHRPTPHDEQFSQPGRPYVWSLLDKMKNDEDTSVEVHFGPDQFHCDNSINPCEDNLPGYGNSKHVVGAYSQLSLVPHIGSDCSMTEDSFSLLDTSIDSNTTESSIFCKEMGAELTVLFNYDAQQEDDVTVRKGDIVLLLNDEDPDWVWVRTEDYIEGFVPSSYVVDLGKLNLDPRAPTTYL